MEKFESFNRPWLWREPNNYHGYENDCAYSWYINRSLHTNFIAHLKTVDAVAEADDVKVSNSDSCFKTGTESGEQIICLLLWNVTIFKFDINYRTINIY